MESVICERQDDYYKVLSTCDKAGHSTAFIEFLLSAIQSALLDATGKNESEQVSAILRACVCEPQSKASLLLAAGLSNAYLNYMRHILPLLVEGLLEMTLPDKPNSRLQKYRITAKGRLRLT